ncbi:hypothetical protein Q8A67_019081 [Cirrhinus molitorella]|uniref:Uncharacterized protein n=1 Tax=Cirrhinus molitorella TaxID=172907 RepID=A0AA88TEQ7_9TELE|nr:hypothetical protein Q8A67_019081 [Cirrhinus molitorella]
MQSKDVVRQASAWPCQTHALISPHRSPNEPSHTSPICRDFIEGRRWSSPAFPSNWSQSKWRRTHEHRCNLASAFCSHGRTKTKRKGSQRMRHRDAQTLCRSRPVEAERGDLTAGSALSRVYAQKERAADYRERDRDRDPGKRSHGSEAQGRNTNIFACATAGAAFDISTAVNYELACREVDRAVNMQNEEERPGPVQHACQLPPSLGAALRTLRPRLPETSIIPVAAHLSLET